MSITEAYEALPSSFGKKTQELLDFFKVDSGSGLTDQQVKENQEKYGRNSTPKEPPTPLWLLIAKQFEDKLVIILILAALVSLFLAFFEEGEEQTTAFFEPLVIFLILFANAFVGVMQESSAEEAVEALKEYESPTATVIRHGKVASIESSELVLGDIVEVAAGDMVPADIRVLELKSSTLAVQQAALTGEPEDITKYPAAIADAKTLQDKKNLLYSGTTVTRGKAKGLVVATGTFTETGKIGKSLSEKKGESFPLKDRLDAFGDQLTWAIGIVCLLVWAINIRHFWDPAFGGAFRGAIYYFKIAVSLAVAAIPEGLPAVITTCLALGTQRMARKKAIVTVLPAVETLGCTNVICSDKTGTLTTNQMCVQEFFLIGGRSAIHKYTVEGIGFDTFKKNDVRAPFAVQTVEGKSIRGNADKRSVELLAAISSLCNESSVTYDREIGFEQVGQSTEAALKVLVEKLPIGFDSAAQQKIDSLADPARRVLAANHVWEDRFDKIYTLEFNRDRKAMSVLVTDSTDDNKPYLFIKGAWDEVLKRSNRVLIDNEVKDLTPALRTKIEKQATEYCVGENCYRCLAVAYHDSPAAEDEIRKADSSQFAKLEQGSIFVAVTGIVDPPRDEVRDAINMCRRAGIRVIVITGDNKNTAVAICRKIGVFGADESDDGKAFTGAEFKEMSNDERDVIVRTAKLFARVEPEDKKHLVQALHRNNAVVAMTGDGVNDAPALKEANIGIAMGTGTAVAKGAAKMVLADDNFATIVAAIEEGRNIYNNTKQFIRYLITSNIGEVVAIFITAIFGLPEVLLPVQLLWVNLVTDGLPAVALGFNRPEDGIMDQDPRPSDEPIVGKYTLFRYMVQGVYIGIATVFGMMWWFMISPTGPGMTLDELFVWPTCTEDHDEEWCEFFEDYTPNTMSLSVLVTIEMFQAINSLSERQSLFSANAHPFSNLYLLAAMAISFGLHFVILYVPLFANIFSVEPLTGYEWFVVALLAFPVVILDEFMKFFDRVRLRRLAQSKKQKAE